VTGRDSPKDYSGVMIFNKFGKILNKETSAGIEKSMNDYIKSQYYLIDLSPLFDYSSKKVRFKPDNFTDMTMKSYIQDMEERFLLNQRKVNKTC
jgi:hypothetical protein